MIVHSGVILLIFNSAYSTLIIFRPDRKSFNRYAFVQILSRLMRGFAFYLFCCIIWILGERIIKEYFSRKIRQKGEVEVKFSEFLALLKSSGWKITEGYIIEQQHKHIFLRTFPALVDKKDSIICFIRKKDIKKAISFLPEPGRPYSVRVVTLVTNKKEKIAFFFPDISKVWTYHQKELVVRKDAYNKESFTVVTKKDLIQMRV